MGEAKEKTPETSEDEEDDADQLDVCALMAKTPRKSGWPAMVYAMLTAARDKRERLCLELNRVVHFHRLSNRGLYEATRGCEKLYAILGAPTALDSAGADRPFLASEDPRALVTEAAAYVRDGEGRDMFARLVKAIHAQHMMVIGGHCADAEALSLMLGASHIRGFSARKLGAVVVLDPEAWDDYAKNARKVLMSDKGLRDRAFAALASEGAACGALAAVLADATDIPDVVEELRARGRGWLDALTSFESHVYLAAFAACIKVWGDLDPGCGMSVRRVKVPFAADLAFETFEQFKASEAPATSLWHLSRASGIHPSTEDNEGEAPGLTVPAADLWSTGNHRDVPEDYAGGRVDALLCGGARLWWNPDSVDEEEEDNADDGLVTLLQQPGTMVMSLVGGTGSPSCRVLATTAGGAGLSESIACWSGFGMMDAGDQADVLRHANNSTMNGLDVLTSYHKAILPELERAAAGHGMQ